MLKAYIDLTVSLRKLLLNPDTKAQTIEYANELMKYDYAHFYNLEECVDKKSYLGLHVSIQPTDKFKNLVDMKQKKIKRIRKIKGGV